MDHLIIHSTQLVEKPKQSPPNGEMNNLWITISLNKKKEMAGTYDKQQIELIKRT